MSSQRAFVRAVLLAISLQGVAARAAPTITTIQEDGAWCWFQDERALIRDGQLAVGSISSQGDIQVARLDLATRARRTAVLHPALERDDHDSPALVFRPDGALMAFYSKHGADNRMRIRETRGDWKSLSFAPERHYTAGLGPGFSYANPFVLSSEGNRLYNFWRGAFWNPSFISSADGGATWGKAARFIRIDGHRPYVKYASDGRSRIHFAFTEAHPNDLLRKEGKATSIHHAYYEGGFLRASGGVPLKALHEGIEPSQATIVHRDPDPASGRAAWIWDLAIDPATQEPILVYSVSVSGAPAPAADHRYFLARFGKGGWQSAEIAHAGTALYPGESFYSGGISIDPDDPRVVYLSSNVNPSTGKPSAGGRYSIHRGVSAASGPGFTWAEIASDPAEDLLRPIVPAGHPDRTFVLYMQGRYTSYVDYSTRIRLLRAP